MMYSSDNHYRPELTNDQLARMAPAIFATEPTEEASSRYSFIRTIEVVDGLRDHGWFPVAARQTQARSKTAIDTRLHVVRFRHPDLQPIEIDGGSNRIYPEAIMTNSHNLTAAFKFMLGAFRMICSNGLVAGESFGSLSVRHNSKAIEEAIAACFKMLGNAQPMMARIDQFRTIELTERHRLAYARSALNMKHGVHPQQLEEGTKPPVIVYGDPQKHRMALGKAEEGQKVEYIPVTPDQILVPRRREDKAPTLWNTYNVIQENLTKGGQYSRSASRRRGRTRPINAIDKDLNINRNLWGMAEYLAEHAA